MPVYNAEAHVAAAIDSALSQTYTDLELLVVDDGSTDGTSSILAGVADPRLRVVRQPNEGLVAALNHGLAECASEFVARLDADDIAAFVRLDLQIRYLDQNPDVAAVGSCYEVVDGDGTSEGVVHVAADPTYLHRRLYFRNTFAHSSMTFRRAEVLDIGGYHEVGPVEDYDLWLRLSARHALGCLPDVLLAYRRSEDSISSRQREEQLYNLALVRSRAHRERPMSAPRVRDIIKQGFAHERAYRHRCSGAMSTYVFDHAWLAVTTARQRRPLVAARLCVAVAMIVLVRPASMRGLLRRNARTTT